MKEGNKSENNNFEFYTEVNKDNNINHIEFLQNPTFQKELIFFKNEILKDINIITKEIIEKHEKFDIIFKTETSKLNKLITLSDSKIKNLSNLISINNHTQEILDSLLSFKQNTESYIISNDIRINNLEQDFSRDIHRHDTYIKDSIIYPGIIGPSAQFKNFHELIDYFLMNVVEIMKYKEKSSVDFITYKSKIESKIDNFQKQIDDFVDDLNHGNKKKFNKIEDKFYEISLKINELIDLNRIENEKIFNSIRQNNQIFMEKIEENIKSINEDNIQIKNKMKKFAHKEQKELNENNSRRTPNYKSKNLKQRISIQNSEKKILYKENNSKFNISRFSQESNNNKNKSNISYSNNQEIKNLENRLKKFIIEEIKKINITKNYNTSKNSLNKELNINSQIINSEKLKKPIKKTLSHGKYISYKKLDKLDEVNLIKKRPTFISNNLNQNILENFMKLNEYKNEYNYEKIKEAFNEESSKSSGTYENVSKKSEKNMEKKKNSNNNYNNKSLTEENNILNNEPEFKKDINNKKVNKSSYDLPFLVKPEQNKKEKPSLFKKSEQNKKEEIEIIPKENQSNNTLTLNQNPNKKERPSLLSLNFSDTFPSNLEIKKNNLNNLKTNLTKPKLNKKQDIIDSNIKFNTSEKFIEEKKEIITKRKSIKNENINNSMNNTINNNINNTINNKIENNIDNIEQKNAKIISSPKISPKHRLSNFEITLKGAKKFNIDSIPNKKHLFNSPTIYMNFPRKYSVYNEKFLESLHPLYRKKKFSKFVAPYISLMTNNLQEMIRYNDKKSVEQRKRNLPWNKSDNFLINKKTQTIETNSEMKLEKRKSKNHYKKIGDDFIKLDDENDMISYNKFKNLIMKDI